MAQTTQLAYSDRSHLNEVALYQGVHDISWLYPLERAEINRRGCYVDAGKNKGLRPNDL